MNGFAGNVVGNKPNIVIGPKDHKKRFLSTKDVCDVWIKRDDRAIDQTLPLRHYVRGHLRRITISVIEDKQVKLWLPQPVVNARALNLEPRHTIAGLYGKMS